jgi:hypothetical protein
VRERGVITGHADNAEDRESTNAPDFTEPRMTVDELLPKDLRVAMRNTHHKSEHGNWCYSCGLSWNTLGCPTIRAISAVELLEAQLRV